MYRGNYSVVSHEFDFIGVKIVKVAGGRELYRDQLVRRMSFILLLLGSEFYLVQSELQSARQVVQTYFPNFTVDSKVKIFLSK